MADVKMAYAVQNCPKCGKKLLKVPAGGPIIGSPLLKCKRCGSIYKTDLRAEWYAYPWKKTLWIIPPLLIGGMLLFGVLFGLVIDDIAIGVASSILGIVIGLCVVGREIVRMLLSKRRMRNPQYLAQLLEHGVITQSEYEAFMRDAS